MPFDGLRAGFFKLRYFVPAAIAFAAAAFIHHPFVLALLLIADTSLMAAICKSMGLIRGTGFSQRVLRRGLAYLVLLTGYSVLTGILIGYPLAWLLRDHSLDATLILTTAAVAALLSLWRIWPAIGLVFLWRGAERLYRPSPIDVLTRSLACAREITGQNEVFFSHGLLVGLCMLLLVIPAMSVAGLGATLTGDFRTAALAVYALLLAPIAHFLIINRCSKVLLKQHQRMRDDRGRLDAVDASEPHPPEVPTQLADDLTQADLNALLLRCVRASQTELALASLDRGADPNTAPDASERDQRSTIVLATLNPDLRLLRGLIAKGADLNRAHAGLSPLIAATRDSHQGRPDAVMTLLTNGADPHCVDAEGNTPLHFAALAADPIVAALLGDASAPLDAVNRDGLTPLGVACSAANWGLARFLLERGAKPEVERAQPALLAAAAIADDDNGGVRLLLKRKAKVDARDTLGRTALMVAALHGHAEIATALIEAGAHVALADQRGTTALMEAARSGAEAVLQVLAARAATPDAVDVNGRSALIIACQSRQSREETVRRLLALGASRELAASDGRRAVDYAAALGRWDIVALLDPAYSLPTTVADGAASVAEVGPDTGHLLDALRFANWNIVEDFSARIRDWSMTDRAELFFDLADHADSAPRNWLRDHGLEASSQLTDGESLFAAVLTKLPATLSAAIELHEAGASPAGLGIPTRIAIAINADTRHRERLEKFAQSVIDCGTEIFAADAEGRTPLAHIVAAGSETIARALLARGVDPNPRDRHGRTPLFDALGLPQEQAVGLIQCLIHAGADPEVVATNGETPLGLALARPETELCYWLNWAQWKLPHRALRPADLPAAAAKGDREAVDKLLKLGLPIHATDAQGATALLRAAGCGHASLIVWLLEQGSDPAQSAPSGATPLSAAISARRDAAVEALLSHGAVVDQRLPGGGSGLMIAAALGYPEIVASLLEHGADANAEDDRGTRPLHAIAQFAFQANDTVRAQRIIESLLQSGASVNATNVLGQTALILLLGGRTDASARADQKHLLALLPLFLSHHADVNQQDERGVSPLHACAMHGLLLPTRALLAVSADAERRDGLGRSAREIAHLLGYIDVAAELGQQDVTGSTYRRTE